MSRTRSSAALYLALHSAGAFAQDDLTQDLFQLDSQLQQEVVSSTKTAQRSAQAPAVVTVVTADEIARRGYTSIAQVLRAVPGFYDVYDWVTHNFGVRGINGGVRASGSVLKLMIDGHPVDYRPTTGNFFDEELIPLGLVERVEVIRGPGSTLYGANAFLGVVNVVTRRGGALSGAQARLGANWLGARPGGHGGLVAGGEDTDTEWVAGGSLGWADRTGLRLPSSSPGYATLSGAASRSDLARPRTWLARATHKKVAGGQLSLQASHQHLDASGEFQDLAPLTHQTRVSWLNDHQRLNYSTQLSPQLDLTFGATHSDARPSELDRLSTGRSDFAFLRRARAEVFGLFQELRWSPSPAVTLIQGLDWVREEHLVPTFDTLYLQDVRGSDGTVLRPAGLRLPGEQSGQRRLLRNAGVFAQGLFSLSPAWSAVVGGRVDAHSIYGLNPSARAGVVYAPTEQALSVKLLYGSSFKAPSVEQLYARPVSYGDISGNERLTAQTAHTFELAGTYARLDAWELSLNGYLTNVLGRVEFVQRGLYLQAQNLPTEWLAGAELEGRARLGPSFRGRLSASVTRSLQRDVGPSLAFVPQVALPLFPSYQVGAALETTPLPGGFFAALEVGYVGPREASQSNALLLGRSYLLPSYLRTGFSLTSPSWTWPEGRDGFVSLRVDNLAARRWGEPGFGGVDVPGPRLQATLTWQQEL